MTDETDKPAGKSRDPRQDRLKSALRENLKRRKQQLRGRADRAAPTGDDEAASDQDAGAPRPSGQNERD